MPTPEFIFRNSRVIESVVEHGFIYDLSRELLTRPVPRIVDVLRAEVDRSGVDIVLAVEGVVRHLQMKARSNEPAATPYNIADSLWAAPSGAVIWVIYDSRTMRPTEYHLLGCPLPPRDSFRGSARPGFRRVWTRNANHKGLSIGRLAEILFSGPQA